MRVYRVWGDGLFRVSALGDAYVIITYVVLWV